jgi:signal transduction histidine kinase
METAAPATELAALANTLAHHLATPVRVLTGNAERLRELLDSSDPDARLALEGIERGTERMRALLDGLLRYARAGDAAGELASIDAGEEARAALAELSDAITDADAEVSVGELPVVSAESRALRTVFACLLSNAINARGDRRMRVQIGCASEPGVWRFTTSDNGIGVAAGDRARIFEPFVSIRADHGRSGVGLGLTLARQIVERHGGEIWFHSAPGEGTAFHFTLPVEPQP